MALAIEGLDTPVNRLRKHYDEVIAIIAEDQAGTRTLVERDISNNAQLMIAHALIVIADQLEGIKTRLGE